MNTLQMQPTVLLIDDSVDESRVLAAILSAARYRLLTANNSTDGIKQAVIFRPALIIANITRTRIDTLALCKILNSDVRTTHIPIIIITSAEDILGRIEGYFSGAVDYIEKPVLADEILVRLAVRLRHCSIPKLSRDEWQKQQTAAANTPSSIQHWMDGDENPQTIVRNVCQMVAANLRHNWTNEILSEKTGMPGRTLAHLFREVLGVTVVAWIREYRMQQASKGLLQSNLSIRAISQDLGFDFSANFSTSFKTRFGMTPREYRQQLRKNLAANAERMLAVDRPPSMKRVA